VAGADSGRLFNETRPEGDKRLASARLAGVAAAGSLDDADADDEDERNSINQFQSVYDVARFY